MFTGSFDYSPKFLDINPGDSSDISSDQGETKILEDLAEAMNENLQISKSGKVYFKTEYMNILRNRFFLSLVTYNYRH